MKNVKRTAMGVLVLLVLMWASLGFWVLGIHMGQRQNPSELQKAQRAQTHRVTFEVAAPENTPEDQTLYIAGSVPALGNWDAAGLALQRDEDGIHRATVELLTDVEYTFKITRGTWGTVERTADDQDLPDRVLRPDGEQTVRVAVARWIDGGLTIPGRITLTGEFREHKRLTGDGLTLPRDVLVFLPPGYDEQTDRRYPVLYLHDGQNLFNEATAFAGVEWGLDERAMQLIEQDVMEPLIIVGIYNTENRTAEYTPPHPEQDNAKADRYARFVAEQIKPMIDRIYRTHPQPRHNIIGGSGLGAVVSLYTAATYPDAFGGVAALSPWQWGGEPHMLHDWWPGEADVNQLRAWVDDPQLAQRLEEAGLSAEQLHRHNLAEDAQHHEAAWGRRMGDVLQYFFPAPTEQP